MINKTMIVLAFGVLCIQTSFAYKEDCSGWRFESQYRADWYDARTRCTNLDGELWRPTNDIWYCALSLIRRIDAGYIWTGANRYSEKHSWEWTDSSSVSGTNWIEGEPNDSGDEDCVVANDRGWNDEHCRDIFMFVCQWPICGGRINRNGACNEKADDYDRIIYRHESSRNSGEGRCTSPGKCESCADGFFTNNGYCSICPKIDHCNHRRCSGYSDNHCVFCVGSIKPMKHWEAYTLSSDKRHCNKACSWRSDSTRCYPGSCGEQLASKCNCTKGFSGIHCDEITESINITHAEAKLSDESNTILTTPDDPNVPYNQPVKWSNNNQWKFLELDFSLKYHTFERPPKPDPTGFKHFVTYFEYEIVKALLVIEHRRKGVSRNNRTLNCRNGNSYPIFDITNCGKGKQFNIQSWRFQHADKLTITSTAENGGFLKYIDRENDDREIKVELKGKTVHSSLIFRWDYIKPYQECINGSKLDCNRPPVDCKDVSKQVWRGHSSIK